MAIIKCPECGGSISDQALTCPHCGVELGQCPECGEIIKYRSNTCPNCGTELCWDEQTSINDDVEESFYKKNKAGIITAIIIIVVLGAIGCFFIGNRMKQDYSVMPDTLQCDTATVEVAPDSTTYDISNEIDDNDETTQNNEDTKEGVSTSFTDSQQVLIFLCAHNFKAENGNVITFQDEGHTVCMNGTPLTSIQRIIVRDSQSCFITLSGPNGTGGFVLSSQYGETYLADVKDVHTLYYAE